MSSPKAISRRALLLGGGALALLSACGFTPLHGAKPSSSLAGRVRYVVPNTVAGYRLRQGLEEQFGQGNELTLAVTLSITSVEAATTPSGAIMRYTLLGRAEYRLSDAAGTALTSGSVDSFTGYSASPSTRATISARSDAEDRLAALLADRIGTRLLLLPTP